MRLFFVLVFLILASCSKKYEVLSEKRKIIGEHDGHTFFLDKKMRLEVVKVNPKTLQFYFYESDGEELKKILTNEILLKDGILDPAYTKANYGITFVDRKNFYEGILSKIKLEDESHLKLDLVLEYKNQRKEVVLVFK